MSKKRKKKSNGKTVIIKERYLLAIAILDTITALLCLIKTIIE